MAKNGFGGPTGGGMMGMAADAAAANAAAASANAGGRAAMGGGGPGWYGGLNSFAMRNMMTQLGPQGFQDMMLAMGQGQPQGQAPAAPMASSAALPMAPGASLPRPQNVMPQMPVPVPVGSPNVPGGAQGVMGVLMRMMLARRFGLGLGGGPGGMQ